MSYYGIATISDEILKPKTDGTEPKILRETISYFLDEPVSVGSTPAQSAFYPDMLLPDLSRNPDFKMPVGDGMHPAHLRQALLPWFAQEQMFATLMKGVDHDLGDPKWGEFVPTVLVHGDIDAAVPLEASERLAKVIGEC